VFWSLPYFKSSKSTFYSIALIPHRNVTSKL